LRCVCPGGVRLGWVGGRARGPAWAAGLPRRALCSHGGLRQNAGPLAPPAAPAQQPGRRGSDTTRLLGAQANAACLSTSGKLLTEKIDVMRLTFYIAPITAVFILPLLLHVEVRCAGPRAAAARAQVPSETLVTRALATRACAV
jgi:hypothetical protein